MCDLISRKAIIDMLKELCENKDTSAYGLQLMGNYEAMRSKIAERDCVKSIIEEINDIPTAHDVDKVVEQLEDAIDCGYEEWLNGVSEYYNSVVDIVKKGGLEE